LCPACPEHPLCSGDGLGAPDTILVHAGQKEALEHVAGNVFTSGAVEISLGYTLGNATGDALRLV
jgi:hypothetical protein